MSQMRRRIDRSMAGNVEVGRTPIVTFVRTMMGDEFYGDARLYHVDGFIDYTDSNDRKLMTRYIIVSAAIVPSSGPETFIFPADSDGNVLSFDELEGSFKGDLDHEQALAYAGYDVGYNNTGEAMPRRVKLLLIVLVILFIGAIIIDNIGVIT